MSQNITAGGGRPRSRSDTRLVARLLRPVSREGRCWLMRCLAVLVIAASASSCSPHQVAEQAFVPPAPMPPTLHAPICVRPAEEAAIDVSALVSQLQVITVACHTDGKYNAIILRLRPTLVTNERNLSSFFKRAYGRQAQKEHDAYITELANLQSLLGSKSGNQFRRLYSGMLDEIRPLSTTEALATYVQRKRCSATIRMMSERRSGWSLRPRLATMIVAADCRWQAFCSSLARFLIVARDCRWQRQSTLVRLGGFLR